MKWLLITFKNRIIVKSKEVKTKNKISKYNVDTYRNNYYIAHTIIGMLTSSTYNSLRISMELQQCSGGGQSLWTLFGNAPDHGALDGE